MMWAMMLRRVRDGIVLPIFLPARLATSILSNTFCCCKIVCVMLVITLITLVILITPMMLMAWMMVITVGAHGRKFLLALFLVPLVQPIIIL
jgi:hypothetical protein